ncbi:MAG: ABC transporter substrate-binding protein [Dehalococcoidia bacterium]|nr:ABC transporter substrate-binding protein [Dehalococcoidia bacterium]MDH4291108.1 ABC transporter substrate-binding protein [Dehalococcoidia bacterium]
MRTISSFLIAVALIAGMVGCTPGPVQYHLIVSTTEGGEVLTPDDGTLSYDDGTVVPLVVFPHTGYRFVNWTGDVSTVADVNAASTTITMNGDYEITANFEETQPIAFAIAGPMADVLGEHQWWGAELARDEISAGLGVNVGGVYHKIELVQVDTNEISGSPDEGVTALQAVIGDVDFVVGGLTPANVVVYREVAMDAQKIFLNCGAFTDALQFSVVTNYTKYRYWFSASHYNGIFLVWSLFKMTRTIGTVLKNTLLSYGDAVDEDYRVPEDGRLRVAIVIEDAPWADRLASSAPYLLPGYGFAVVGTCRPSPEGSNISAELKDIAAAKPHIIFTAFQGEVAVVYSTAKADLEIPAMTIGVNIPGEEKEHWANTGGKCNGEIQIDTWGEGLQNTGKTTGFFNAFTAETGEYPLYPAATYDAIYQLKEAIEAVSAAHHWDGIADVVDPDNIDALIQYLETSRYTGTACTTAYYPMPETNIGDGTYALSEAQVRALYPTLGTYNEVHWRCAATAIPGPHIAHDIVYGPGYVTGIGSQWQDGHKVGVWPMDLGDDYDAALTDQYGCWNFEYPGTVDVMIPIEGFLAS